MFRAVPELRPRDLSGVVRIYRGFRETNANSVHLHRFSIAWTLNRGIAAWFALRAASDRIEHAWIFPAAIDADSILAVIHDRGEAEVVVDPRDITLGAAEHPNDQDLAAVESIIEARKQEFKELGMA